MRNLIALALFTSCSTLTPAEHAYAPPPPPSTPIQVCWLETGGTTAPARYASAGPTRLERWEVTSSALLVRHPSGDLLIDTGISPDAATEASELSAYRHFVFNQTAGRNEVRGALPSLLSALGVTTLKGVILSHAHPDHAGGVASLPSEVPVWVGAPELGFVNDPRRVVLPAQARAINDRVKAITFADVPYALSDQSWDVFGDGSIVVVPTYGHTPGSVATFINLSPTQRLMHVGDLINVTESLEHRVGKSWAMRTFTDENVGQTEAQVSMLIALHQQDPALTILPAHDRPAHEAVFGSQRPGVSPCIATTN